MTAVKGVLRVEIGHESKSEYFPQVKIEKSDAGGKGAMALSIPAATDPQTDRIHTSSGDKKLPLTL